MKSDYEQSLDFLLKVYNVFLYQALSLLKNSPAISRSLQQALSIWVHPKGISNLVKTIALNYRADLPHPQVAQMQQEEKLNENELPLGMFNEEAQDLAGKKNEGKNSEIQSELINEAIAEESEEGEESLSMGSLKVEEENQSSYNDQNSKLYKRGPYKSYSMDEKLKAVQLFMEQEMSITEISRTLGIPCKNIKRWATEGIFRKRGGGRRRTNPSLEEDVFRWLTSQHSFGDSIRVEEIQQYALSRSHDSTFKASRGWAIKFIQRYSLRNRYMIV